MEVHDAWTRGVRDRAAGDRLVRLGCAVVRGAMIRTPYTLPFGFLIQRLPSGTWMFCYWKPWKPIFVAKFRGGT